MYYSIPYTWTDVLLLLAGELLRRAAPHLASLAIFGSLVMLVSWHKKETATLE